MTEINVARTGLEDVEEALKDVIDPELGVNIVDLGLLYGLKYSDDDGALLIDMTRLEQFYNPHHLRPETGIRWVQPLPGTGVQYQQLVQTFLQRPDDARIGLAHFDDPSGIVHGCAFIVKKLVRRLWAGVCGKRTHKKSAADCVNHGGTNSAQANLNRAATPADRR